MALRLYFVANKQRSQKKIKKKVFNLRALRVLRGKKDNHHEGHEAGIKALVEILNLSQE